MDKSLAEIVLKDTYEKWIITYNKGGSYGKEAFKGAIGQWVAENTVLAKELDKCYLISAHKVSATEFNSLYYWL